MVYFRLNKNIEKVLCEYWISLSIQAVDVRNYHTDEHRFLSWLGRWPFCVEFACSTSFLRLLWFPPTLWKHADGGLDLLETVNSSKCTCEWLFAFLWSLWFDHFFRPLYLTPNVSWNELQLHCYLVKPHKTKWYIPYTSPYK